MQSFSLLSSAPTVSRPCDTREQGLSLGVGYPRPVLRALQIAWVLALLAAACGGGSSEPPGTLPPVTGFVERPVVGCNLGLGTGEGAQVVQVFEGRPASGILEADDVILAVGGQQIENAPDLVRAVQSLPVDGEVAVVVERDGERSDYTIALDPEFVNESGQPVIGVTVATSVDLIRPQDLAAGLVPGGDFVRSLELEGSLYALDPLAGEWHSFGASAPDGGWIGFDGDVWMFDSEAAEPVLAGITSGRTVPLIPDDWDLQLPFGRFDNSVVFLADRPSNDPESLAAREPGLVALDLASGRLSWSWVPGPVSTDDGQWVPVAVFASPQDARLLVGLTVNDGRALSSAVLDADGLPVTPWERDGSAFLDLLPFGWFDETRLTFFDPGTGQAVLIPVVGGTATPLPALAGEGFEYVWPVGDGVHVMIQASGRLNLIDGGGERRALAVQCESPTMGDIGFGA